MLLYSVACASRRVGSEVSPEQCCRLVCDDFAHLESSIPRWKDRSWVLALRNLCRNNLLASDGRYGLRGENADSVTFGGHAPRCLQHRRMVVRVESPRMRKCLRLESRNQSKHLSRSCRSRLPTAERGFMAGSD